MNNLIKKQLKLFLKNPVFYICAIIFTVYVYVNYFMKLQNFMGTGTSNLLLYFTSVPYVCILIIPALCYKANFTIYDDFLPYSKCQKVISRFLYIFISYVILLILLIPGVVFTFFLQTVDFGQIITSFTCLLFYGSALISVCIFIESLINSHVVAFVISAIVLTLCNCSHLFPVYLQNTTFFSQVFKEISFAWHFDAASKGILDTRDFIFLMCITFFFLQFNVRVSNIRSGKVYERKEKINFILTTSIFILILLNSSNFYKRFDFSKNKIYSLSKYTKQLNQNIDKTVKLTYYRSSELTKLYPQIRDVSDFLMTYSATNKNISLQIKDPNKEKLTELLENYGIYSQQLRNVKNNSTQYINVYSAIVIEYNGNAEVIPFIMSADSLEYEIDGRILHLISGEERFVNIIIGNYMNLQEDYSYVIPYLTNNGFVCNVLDCNSNSFTSDLEKAQGPLLIIGDENINIENAIAIESYILKEKGNALITTSPFTTQIENDWSMHFAQKTNLVEMIENWGVEFTNNICADFSCARITMYSQEDSGTTTKVLNYPLWISLMPQENCKAGATIFWPTNLNIIESEKVKPLLITSKNAWTNEVDRHNVQSIIETNPFILEEQYKNEKVNHPCIVGAKISGSLSGLFTAETSNHSEIIVIPDQYFLNSLMNEYIGGEYGDYRNFDYMVYLLLQLNGEEELAKLQYMSVENKGSVR